MAYKLVNTEWCPTLNDYQRDYIADTESDVATLPESCTGSSALIVESGKVYVVNASGAWSVYGG